MMKKKGIFLAVAAIGAFIACSDAALADPIDLQVNVGAPIVYPPAVVAAPPLMVWLADLGVYAAYGSSQPIFYSGNSYYYFYGNRWWAGPAYRGPWHPIPAPPPALRRWSPGEWRHVQERAQYYARDPHWRHFRPLQRPLPAPPPQYRPHGPEQGRQPDRQWQQRPQHWQHEPQQWQERPQQGHPGPQGPHPEHGQGPGERNPGHGPGWQNQQ